MTNLAGRTGPRNQSGALSTKAALITVQLFDSVIASDDLVLAELGDGALKFRDVRRRKVHSDLGHRNAAWAS